MNKFELDISFVERQCNSQALMVKYESFDVNPWRRGSWMFSTEESRTKIK